MFCLRIIPKVLSRNLIVSKSPTLLLTLLQPRLLLCCEAVQPKPTVLHTFLVRPAHQPTSHRSCSQILEAKFEIFRDIVSVSLWHVQVSQESGLSIMRVFVMFADFHPNSRDVTICLNIKILILVHVTTLWSCIRFVTMFCICCYMISYKESNYEKSVANRPVGFEYLNRSNKCPFYSHNHTLNIVKYTFILRLNWNVIWLSPWCLFNPLDFLHLYIC